MTNLILVNKKDLKDIFIETVNEIFEHKEAINNKAGKYLLVGEAVKYINEKGLEISKSHLYKHTACKTVPFRRFGDRKIVFEPHSLDEWIAEQLSDKKKG